jgi:hypothetical protein
MVVTGRGNKNLQRLLASICEARVITDSKKACLFGLSPH